VVRQNGRADQQRQQLPAQPRRVRSTGAARDPGEKRQPAVQMPGGQRPFGAVVVLGGGLRIAQPRNCGSACQRPSVSNTAANRSAASSPASAAAASSGEALVAEMEAAGPAWRLADLAPRLAGRPVLLVGTGRDPVTPVETHHAPVPPVVVAPAVAYGAVFMTVPATVTALVRAGAPPHRLTGVLAAFTVLFAAGQMTGPWLAGLLADRTGPGAGLVWTAALCGTASLVATLGLRRRPGTTANPGRQRRTAVRRP
jgi:MFS family permease